MNLIKQSHDLSAIVPASSQFNPHEFLLRFISLSNFKRLKKLIKNLQIFRRNFISMIQQLKSVLILDSYLVGVLKYLTLKWLVLQQIEEYVCQYCNIY